MNTFLDLMFSPQRSMDVTLHSTTQNLTNSIFNIHKSSDNKPVDQLTGRACLSECQACHADNLQLIYSISCSEYTFFDRRRNHKYHPERLHMLRAVQFIWTAKKPSSCKSQDKWFRPFIYSFLHTYESGSQRATVSTMAECKIALMQSGWC